ncbi:MAG: hypothetical protein ACHQZS_09050 [Candidatus Binatales bacterium]
MVDEADEIYAEVKRRKDRAQELGVPELIWDLFDTVKHFPSYSRNNPEGYQRFVPEFVTEIQEPSKENVAFQYDGVRYLFNWSTKRVESSFSSRAGFEMSLEDGLLILHVNDEGVFELTLRGEQDFSGDDWVPETWKVREIQAFIEGPWVEGLRGLNSRIKEHRRRLHEAEAKRRREEPSRLAELKSRFGIK